MSLQFLEGASECCLAEPSPGVEPRVTAAPASFTAAVKPNWPYLNCTSTSKIMLLMTQLIPVVTILKKV